MANTRRLAMSAFNRCLRSTNAFRCRHAARYYSTPANNADGSLPLQGYRVLDMTRVLAGVSHSAFPLQISKQKLTLLSRVAILHTDPRRLGVSNLA